MLDHYHTLTGTLNEAEALLLDEHSQELVRVFRSGHKRLNWNSLGNGSQPSVYCLLYLNCDIRVFVDAVNESVSSTDKEGLVEPRIYCPPPPAPGCSWE